MSSFSAFDVQFRFGQWMVVEYSGFTTIELKQHLKTLAGQPLKDAAMADTLKRALIQASTKVSA